MPNKAEEVEGLGSLQKVVLERESGSSCEVYVYAAHITSWKTAEGKERLYVSSTAEFAKGKAIRGGVPICWPQFAGRGSYMKHGFARSSASWKVRRMVERPDPSVTLELRDCEESASWPFSFVFTYTVTLEGDALKMDIQVVNQGDGPLTFTGALHQYFVVSDVKNVNVGGLRGLTFEDNTKGGEKSEEKDEQVKFEGETDRVYLDTPDEIFIVDGDSSMSLQKHGWPDCIVWNIGGDSLKDMGPGEWQRYVCVEAGIVDKPVEVAPGQSWSGNQRFVAGVSAPAALADVGTADGAMSAARMSEIQEAFRQKTEGKDPALSLQEAYEVLFSSEERGEYGFNDFCGDIDGFASKMASKDKLTWEEAKLFLETVG